MASSIVPIIVAASQAAERRMLERLQQAGASAPERAVAESALDLAAAERAALARYRVKQLVREGEDGRLWLDEGALEAYRARARASGRRALLVLVATALLVVAVVLVLRLVMQAEAPPPPI